MTTYRGRGRPRRSDVVPHKAAALTNPAENNELVTDLCRFREKILSREEITAKHHLTADDLERFGADDALVRAVMLKEIERRHNGARKRETAQYHAVKLPDMLDGIMSDANAGHRARTEAGKVLNTIADGPAAERQDAADRFQITINLGADTEVYDKLLKPVGPDVVDLPAIGTKE